MKSSILLCSVGLSGWLAFLTLGAPGGGAEASPSEQPGPATHEASRGLAPAEALPDTAETDGPRTPPATPENPAPLLAEADSLETKALAWEDLSDNEILLHGLTLKRAFSRASGSAYMNEWANGQIHTLEMTRTQAGTSTFTFRPSKDLLVSRRFTPGTEQIGEEVRLDPSRYPEIYAMKAELDALANLMHHRGLDVGILMSAE